MQASSEVLVLDRRAKRVLAAGLAVALFVGAAGALLEGRLATDSIEDTAPVSPVQLETSVESVSLQP
jgi:hypothetical protein